MIDVDKYLLKAKPYHKIRNNCFHFFNMVWRDITGRDFSHLIPARSSAFKGVLQSGIACSVDQIDAPESPCIAYFPKARGATHIGVFDSERVLHQDSFGAHFEILDRMIDRYGQPRFYK